MSKVTEYIIRTAESNLKDVRKTLIMRCKNLSKELEYEAKQLEENPNYNSNNLGIVQNEGNVIDRLCYQLTTIENNLRNYRRMEQEYNEQPLKE